MQCEVYRNRDDTSGDMPYLLDVQADLLSELKTRVVIPLIRAEAFGRRADRLHPRFELGGQAFVLATHLIAAIRMRDLGAPIGSLRDQRDAVISAIDVLWSGV